MHLALPEIEIDRVVCDERAEPLRDPAELERQIGARARGTRTCRRVVRHAYVSFIGLVGILTLPAFICLMSAFILTLMSFGTVLLMPSMPRPSR